MSDERFDQDLRSVLQEDAPRDVPRAHSTYAVTARRRDLGERFSTVRREIFTESSTGTNCRRWREMPWDVCSKRLHP